MTQPLYPDLALGPLRWWDIPTVESIERDLFAGDSPWSAAMFWSELAQGHYYLACWDGAELIAYGGLAATSEEAQLQTLAVRSDRQGGGVGRRLLTALIAHAEARPIFLEVRTGNEAALGLYGSMGFRRVGVRRAYYQPSGADAYTMVRNS